MQMHRGWAAEVVIAVVMELEDDGAADAEDKDEADEEDAEEKDDAEEDDEEVSAAASDGDPD